MPFSTSISILECCMIVGPHSTKLPQSWDTGSDQPSVPAISISVLQYLVDGNRLSQETACRLFGGFPVFTALLSQSAFLFVNCREGSASHSLHLALAMVMVTFRTFSGLFTDPFLSGRTELLLLQVRCISHQNSQRLF